jgi:hypothetical protein
VGPIALFDKSFIQALTVDESVWFDHFFTPVVCPIFYVETLADLAKSPKGDRSAESEVRIISSKFPEVGGSVCANHLDLSVLDILGTFHVPMVGRIPRPGGRYVTGGGRSGVVYDYSAEDAAFQRWQLEKFYDVERLFAAGWRTALNSLDLKQIASALQVLGVTAQSCKSLEDAKQIAQSVVSGSDKPFERLGLAVRFFNIPQERHADIIERWKYKGRPPLEQYAPYAAFVLTIEIFFYVALAAKLISAERQSNRTDVAYLAYLPFCMVFVSSDRLHERTARLFLRRDQEFIWGPDLKADLKRLNEHYLALPEAEREQGIMRFAHNPPVTGDFLVTDLWKRNLRPEALQDKGLDVPMDSERSAELVQSLKAFTKGRTLSPEESVADDEVENRSIERRIKRRKGSWWQVPKDLPDDDDHG